MAHGNSTTADWTATWDTRMVRVETEPVSPEALARLRDADEGTLVAAFQGGQREAFDIIVERHRRQIYQLCYRFSGNHEDASDLTQDAFVRAFRGLRNFKGQASL